jgi:hypothetical protein
MVTVSPYYKQKNVINPFYTVVAAVNNRVSKTVGFKDPLYKNVDKGKGKNILDNRGKFIFQIYNGTTELKQFIKIRKSDIVGHLGMKSRKDTTASSNVNEFLSVFFLIKKYKPDDFVRKVEDDSCKLGSKATGVLNPSSNGVSQVTYEELCELIDKDETAERDIKIGYQNAIAIKEDLKGQNETISKVYWCPRGKPPGVSPKNPSDVVVQLSNDDYIGYSNKISAGADKTPKFNTNINAYFGKLENKSQLEATQILTDEAWGEAVKQIPKNKKIVINGLKGVDITEEPYSETGSRATFGELAKLFRSQDLNFYAEDFYYPFRNTVIKKLGKHLLKPDNLMYFLNTVFFYTYDDPRVKSTPCPYKLLIGNPAGGASTIKNVSENADLKNITAVKKSKQLTNIQFEYNNTGQGFKMKFDWKKFGVVMPITCRTRATGGWAGKSLFIETSGLKISKK